MIVTILFCIKYLYFQLCDPIKDAKFYMVSLCESEEVMSFFYITVCYIYGVSKL